MNNPGYEYPSVEPDNTTRKPDETKKEVSQPVSKAVKTRPAGSNESKVPALMVGTWFFGNPHGDDEQMAIFPDGRVVVLYSNGRKEQTNIFDGSTESGEYNKVKYKLNIQVDGSSVQHVHLRVNGKPWKRIAPEPHINLLRPLKGH